MIDSVQMPGFSRKLRRNESLCSQKQVFIRPVRNAEKDGGQRRNSHMVAKSDFSIDSIYIVSKLFDAVPSDIFRELFWGKDLSCAGRKHFY